MIWLSEQREIARILQTVDRKIEVEERRKRALEVLFQSLLHQLMTGQLRVNQIGEEAKNAHQPVAKRSP